MPHGTGQREERKRYKDWGYKKALHGCDSVLPGSLMLVAYKTNFPS